MPKRKHLTFDERCSIQQGLKQGLRLNKIAASIDKDPSTVSKEIRKHIVKHRSGAFNPCALLKQCERISTICPQCKYKWKRNCRRCSYVKCYTLCPDFVIESCEKLKSPPYVCNGCGERNSCRLERHLYDANNAHNEYIKTLSECRRGVAISYEELKRLDSIVSPLILRGQSIHHICQHNADRIMCDERTIYNYIDAGLLSVSNIELPRKVRFRARKKKRTVRVDKKCHVDRCYEDFQQFISERPDTPVTEMDSVEGRKGGKVLLTVYFRNCELMLAFIRDANTAHSVTAIFNSIYTVLGREAFMELFQLILTDRGSEFTDPLSIEYDENGERRTRIYYCDPLRSDQKGGCEVTHEMIRRILPKGTSFDNLTQEDVNIMMSHINSYTRKKLGNQSPYRLFSSFYGENLLNALNIQQISPNEINLTPKLLNR